MADCIAVTVVREFLSEVLKPYISVLEECQELVILMEESAGEIQSEENKFTIGSLVYSSGNIVAGSLTLAAIGAAAAPLTCGISALTVASGVLAGAFAIAGLVHFIVKALKKWSRHNYVLEVLKQKKIAEKMSQLFMRIGKLEGNSADKEDRICSCKMTKGDIVGKTVSSGASNNTEILADDGVSTKAVDQEKEFKNLLEVVPAAIKSISSAWSLVKIGFGKGIETTASALFGYSMGAVGIVFETGSVVSNALKLINEVKCGRTKDLLALVDMLFSSLQIITEKVLSVTDEVHMILVSHLTCPDRKSVV